MVSGLAGKARRLWVDLDDRGQPAGGRWLRSWHPAQLTQTPGQGPRVSPERLEPVGGPDAQQLHPQSQEVDPHWPQ